MAKQSFQRTALLYDPHHPYGSKHEYHLALDYLKRLKPKVNQIILGGDFADFYKISFWKDDPERMPFKKEVEIVKQELKDLRSQFYRIPIIYLEGNHEQRLYRYVRDKAPELLYRNNVTDVLDLKARNIQYYSNIAAMCAGNLPLRLGKLFVLHGHEKKVSMNAINLARLFYNKCRVNVIAGHHHKTDFALHKKLDGSHEGSWTVGTLGKLTEDYQPINEWNHGLAFVDVFDNNDFEVHNKIILNGRIING
jgi:predicted phosphodiesterase